MMKALITLSASVLLGAQSVRSTAAICPLSPPSMRSRHYGSLRPPAARGVKQRFHCGLVIRRGCA
jgi:hypothetical protein